MKSFLFSLFIAVIIIIFGAYVYTEMRDSTPTTNDVPEAASDTSAEIEQAPADGSTVIQDITNNISGHRIQVIVSDAFIKTCDKTPSSLRTELSPFGLKVDVQKKDGTTLELFSGNYCSLSVDNILFSPDGRFVSLRMIGYEDFIDLLIDIETEKNFNENGILIINSISWEADSSFATIGSVFSEYLGIGSDGVYKLDTKTGSLIKIESRVNE